MLFISRDSVKAQHSYLSKIQRNLMRLKRTMDYVQGTQLGIVEN